MSTLDPIKDYSQQELMRVLDTIQGRKSLVIDTNLTSLLSLVAGFNMLKERGVDKVFTINQEIVNEDKLVIILKPTVENANLLSAIVKRVKQQECVINVFWVPRRTLVCDLLLKDLGVYGDVVIGEYHLDVYPYEPYLMSLNSPNSFKDLYLDGDISILKTLCNSIMKIQLIYGFIPTILGVGKYSQDLVEILEQSRLEYLSHNNLENECEFDSIILLDRNIDYVSVLKQQLTYEGLVDENFNVQSCFLEFDGGSMGGSSAQTKAKKILLNNSDFVFEKIRDCSFEVVGQVLKKIATEMKDEEESRLNMTTPLQLKEFASKLGLIQSKRTSLDIRRID